MGAVTAEEIASLQREFDWVLTTEVDNVTKELKAAVTVRTIMFQRFLKHDLYACLYEGMC